MSDEDKCPKCGELEASRVGSVKYHCGSFWVRKPDVMPFEFELIQSHICKRLAADHAEIERLRGEVNEANKLAWEASRKRTAIVEAVKTPDKLFASQLECAAAEKVRALQAQLAALQAQADAVERLRELLKRMEFSNTDGLYRTCWGCGEVKGDPHLPGCEVAAALDAQGEG